MPNIPRAINKIIEPRIFKTTDGSTFNSMKEAEKHQALIELRALVYTNGSDSWNNDSLMRWLIANAGPLACHLADYMAYDLEIPTT